MGPLSIPSMPQIEVQRLLKGKHLTFSGVFSVQFPTNLAHFYLWPRKPVYCHRGFPAIKLPAPELGCPVKDEESGWQLMSEAHESWENIPGFSSTYWKAGGLVTLYLRTASRLPMGHLILHTHCEALCWEPIPGRWWQSSQKGLK